jgi:hypothetical protein
LDEIEPRIFAQDTQPRLLQGGIVRTAEVVQAENIAAFRQQPAGNVKADKAGHARNQYCLIRHRILEGIDFSCAAPAGPLYPPCRGCGNTRLDGYCHIDFKTIPRRSKCNARPPDRASDTFSNPRARATCAGYCFQRQNTDLRALLYLALRKVNFYELASRFIVASLGWIGLAIAVSFLQIFVGVLRWREISAECGAPLGTAQAMRYNVIGTFFNQTLPSSIGGDAVRLWLLARAGAGWRAATYSIFVDRAIGLIALAVIIVASLPWSYKLISDPHGRSALLFVDFAALAGGTGFLILGRLPWPWLKRWWGTHHLHACSVIANRVIFSRQRGPKIAVLSLLVHVHHRHRLVRGAVDRGACGVRPDLSTGTAGDADHHAADLDRRLGRPRGNHGPGVRICRAGDK